MRITTNSLSENLIRQIQQLGSQQSKLQTQVATGQRIVQPEDDPAAMGRVLNFESEQRQVSQYLGNTNRALELSQTSFSGLQQIKKVSDRATEIGTLGSGVLGADAAHAYASELDQLIEHTLQLGNSKLRNDYLYAGTAVDTVPFAAQRDAQGKVTTVAYQGNAASSSVQLSESASVAPGTTGATNLGLRDFINQLVSLRDALTASDAAGIKSAQTNLLANEDKLVSALAENGGVQSRIEANRSQQQDRAGSLASLVSGETDTDMASTIVRLNQTQNAYQAALQSTATIMRISLLDYIK